MAIQQQQERRNRLYFDVACLLWYKVLYEDVLAYKSKKMLEQLEPFLLWQMGDRFMRFGVVKALTKQEDITKFEKVAQAELRDLGFGKLKVRAYPDGIVVSY